MILERRSCATCGEGYRPAPGGYNSLYCSSLCKSRRKGRRRYYDPETRKQAFQATAADRALYARHLAYSRQGRTVTRNWLADYKLERGCVDCGFNAHHAALQLDHEGVKTVKIADARSSLTRLKEEIRNGQCVVRCGNCHAIKTWERKFHGVPTARILAWKNGSSLDRGNLDSALVAFAFAVDDLREAVAKLAHCEVTSRA